MKLLISSSDSIRYHSFSSLKLNAANCRHGVITKMTQCQYSPFTGTRRPHISRREAPPHRWNGPHQVWYYRRQGTVDEGYGRINQSINLCFLARPRSSIRLYRNEKYRDGHSAKKTGPIKQRRENKWMEWIRRWALPSRWPTSRVSRSYSSDADRPTSELNINIFIACVIIITSQEKIGLRVFQQIWVVECTRGLSYAI